MPCDMYKDVTTGDFANDTAQDAKRRSEEAERQASAATRATCDLFRVLREALPEQWEKIEPALSSETRNWILRHDAQDRLRRS